MRIIGADETVIEIAADRRRLQSATAAVVDAQDLCARARLLLQESQVLLRQVDEERHGTWTAKINMGLNRQSSFGSC